MERWKFTYDVAVNVLANLVAGAILYLAGAYLGLFPSNPAALVTAWTALVVVIIFGSFVVAAIARASLASLVLAPIAVGVIVVGGGLLTVLGATTTLTIVMAAIVVPMALLAVVLIERRNERDGPPTDPRGYQLPPKAP